MSAVPEDPSGQLRRTGTHGGVSQEQEQDGPLGLGRPQFPEEQPLSQTALHQSAPEDLLSGAPQEDELIGACICIVIIYAERNAVVLSSECLPHTAESTGMAGCQVPVYTIY